MIEIKITDVNYTTTDELLNLIDFLKRAVEINKLRSFELTESNLVSGEFENIPDLNNMIEHKDEGWPSPMPSAVFAKCSSTPEPELRLRDFSNSGQQSPVVTSILNKQTKSIEEVANIIHTQMTDNAHLVSKIELDSKGLPWDSRIHARTKTKNKDGSWKGLRGVGPKMLDKVEDELKTIQEIPVIPSIPLPPEAPPKDFAAFMTLVTTNITNKKIEKVDVNKVLSHFKIPSIPVVATRPDLIPAIIMALEELINEA